MSYQKFKDCIHLCIAWSIACSHCSIEWLKAETCRDCAKTYAGKYQQ